MLRYSLLVLLAALHILDAVFVIAELMFGYSRGTAIEPYILILFTISNTVYGIYVSTHL
jgi:hypothetical protein